MDLFSILNPASLSNGDLVLSSTSNRKPSQSRLLALPVELQHKVIKCLKFPEVHRLSSTCTRFRDAIYKGLYGQSLLELEVDFIETSRDPTLKGPLQRPAFATRLIEKGYAHRDIGLVQDYAPCYTCRRLVLWKNFDSGNGMIQARALSRVGVSLPIRPEEDRRCIECDLKAGLPNQTCPWLKSYDRLIGYCRHCHDVRESAPNISHIQVENQLCDTCVEFAEDTNGREVYRPELRRRISQMQDYERWMADVDRIQHHGQFGGFENELQRPDWNGWVQWRLELSSRQHPPG